MRHPRAFAAKCFGFGWACQRMSCINWRRARFGAATSCRVSNGTRRTESGCRSRRLTHRADTKTAANHLMTVGRHSGAKADSLAGRGHDAGAFVRNTSVFIVLSLEPCQSGRADFGAAGQRWCFGDAAIENKRGPIWRYRRWLRRPEETVWPANEVPRLEGRRVRRSRLALLLPTEAHRPAEAGDGAFHRG